MTSASQSSGLGDSDSITMAPAISHWKGLLCGEVEDSNQRRKQMPPEGASVAGQPRPSGSVAMPASGSEQSPRAAGPPLLALWAAWLTLLPIVYIEGVIHKNSRTTIFFHHSYSLVLAPPSTSPAHKLIG